MSRMTARFDDSPTATQLQPRSCNAPKKMRVIMGKAALLALLFAASAATARAHIPAHHDVARELERSANTLEAELGSIDDAPLDVDVDARSPRLVLQLDRHFDFALELGGELVDTGACAELAEESRPAFGLRNEGSRPAFAAANFNLVSGLRVALRESRVEEFCHRWYDSRSGRYTQADPIGLGGGVNIYNYANGVPTVLFDPYGLFSLSDETANLLVPVAEFLPDIPSWVGDFSAGAGDVALMGTGGALRNALGIGGIDECSRAYSAGEWVGIVGTTVAGGAQGVRAAGTSIKGVTEFSHWLPARYFRPGGPSFKPLLTKVFGWAEKTVLNGNYVSRARHYYHDPFRYPRGWQALGEKWPALLQQLDRIPNLYKGAIVGGGVGSAAAALAGNKCGCRS